MPDLPEFPGLSGPIPPDGEYINGSFHIGKGAIKCYLCYVTFENGRVDYNAHLPCAGTGQGGWTVIVDKVL